MADDKTEPQKDLKKFPGSIPVPTTNSSRTPSDASGNGTFGIGNLHFGENWTSPIALSISPLADHLTEAVKKATPAYSIGSPDFGAKWASPIVSSLSPTADYLAEALNKVDSNNPGIGNLHFGKNWTSPIALSISPLADHLTEAVKKATPAYSIGSPDFGAKWAPMNLPSITQTTNSLASLLSATVPKPFGIGDLQRETPWDSMTAITPSPQAMKFDLGRGDENGRRLDAIQAAAESAEGSARRLCSVADRVESETLPAIRRFAALDEFFRKATVDLNGIVVDIQSNVTKSTSHLEKTVNELKGSSKIAVAAVVITAVITIAAAFFSSYLGNETSNQYKQLLEQQLEILSKIQKIQEDANFRQKELEQAKSMPSYKKAGMPTKISISPKKPGAKAK